MEPTRQLWAVVGLAVWLTVFGVVLGRLFALAGAVVLGAWVVSRQYLFYRATTALSADLSVRQTPAKPSVRTEQTVPTTLTASLDSVSRLTWSVTGGLPAAATSSGRFTCTADPGQTTASVTVDSHWPLAGEHRFDRATVTASDGLFRQQFPAGSRPVVTVEPRGPQNIHVGEGGDRIGQLYGEHRGGLVEAGLEPAQTREYRPGDDVDRIDWNATARLGTLYVREFETETDQTTLLVVDHRESLADGSTDEAKLDYLRELALALVASAEEFGDPLGMLSVGDDGVTERFAPSTDPGQYASVRRAVLGLEPTTGTDRGAETAVSGPGTQTGPTTRQETRTLADVHRVATALEGEQSQLARTLRPFYRDRKRYLDRISDDPLYSSVRQALGRDRASVATVLCTDDSAPAELLETVRLASQRGGPTLVLLAPTVLYEPGGLSEPERAYERYVEFEDLRRKLSRLEGVTALEVGPGDRLSTVLATGRNRRVGARAGGGGS